MDRVEDDRLVDLMIAYQRGELAAFEELFLLLHVNIRNYLASIGRDPQGAEDLAQETFLQVHRSRHTYAPPRPVRPWVFGIARNVYLMDRRARGRKARHEGLAKEDLPEVPVHGTAEDLPVTDELLRGLESLPENRREAVILHHVHGFSFAEIGAMLGISARAARLRSFRGIQGLRDILGAGEAS
jgi:RNA polymerase sigma-70 factor (ECF subfamily)